MPPRYEVRIERRVAIPVAVVRRHSRPADLSRIVPEGCGLVWEALQSQGVHGGRHVALYWDATIRLEVGAEVSAPFVEQDEIVRSAIPGGLVASTTHLGPYSGLGAAHDAIRAWCAANHHRLAGPCWEIYGHWERDWDLDPSRIRTEVAYQLAKE